MDHRLKERLRRLREEERGPGKRVKDAPLRMVLLYPSPYRAAMSSLGFLQIRRLAHLRPGTTCDRAVLPEPTERRRHRESRTPLLTIEAERPLGEAHVIGISHAYELELSGIVQALDLSGIPPLARDRTAAHPLILLGGPITFSNPLPSAPLADVLILGEGESCLGELLCRLEERPSAARGSNDERRRVLDEVASLPGFYVPSVHGERLPPIARAEDAELPAVSDLWTPNAELRDMLLIEPERGCHRGCTFCVMRRSTNGGMRLVEREVVDRLVPDEAVRVGLVGAAVSDHPRIKEILRSLIDERGKQIGISSLRADRLDEEFVGLLARGGYRSMTVALDAASVRLRDEIEKNLKNRHVERAAELAREHGMRHLKIYVIIGLPGETEEDIAELARFALSLRKTLPVVLAVSPFVPKFHTPLADAPFMGEERAGETLSRLKKLLGDRVEVRSPGPREAYVEYRLAQGGHAHALAAIAAARSGGGLGAWKRALREVPLRVRPPNFCDLLPMPTMRRRHRAA